MSAGEIKHISYSYPIFEDLKQPKGYLTLDHACHACFWYVMLAMKARAVAGVGPDSQIIEYKVGDLPPEWMESRDEEIARSIATIYGLESPDKFLAFKKEAFAQAVAYGLDAQEVEKVLRVQPGRANKIH